MLLDTVRKKKKKLPVYWGPQEGPQVAAATAPIDELFFGGTRGGGKSDCAIGRQVRGCVKYGHAWNGLMLRRKYKDLGELRRRFDELILMGMPAERTGGPQQVNYITFLSGPAKGAKITLAAIKQLEQADDWIGHQFCVAKGTKITMGDGSPKNIEDVRPGDMVMTLEGPKPVKAITGGRKAQCVKSSTAFGEQVHPLEHPILTGAGWQSYASILETYSRDTARKHQESGQLPDVYVLARLHKRSLDLTQLTAFSTECDTFYKRDQQKMEKDAQFGRTALLSALDSRPLLEPFELSQDYTFWPFFDGVAACGWSGLEGVVDFPYDYPVYSRSCDERFPGLLESAQEILPLSGDAALPFPYNYTQGVLGSTPLYIPDDGQWYEHPYTGEVRQATEECVYVPCKISFHGEEIVYDICVDVANHYIGFGTGFVHKNTEIAIDEAPTFPFLALLIDKLRGSLRSPHGVPCRMFLTGNPGGPGASIIKLMFIDADPDGTGKVRKVVVEDPVTGETMDITQAFIRSTLSDNKILCVNDPKYVARLRSIKDPNLRAAWLDGRWDVYIGQAFKFSEDRHVLQPEQEIWPIPDYAPLYMTFDWGYGAPFSVGWWWVDSDDRIYRFAEWYGWNGVTPNVGMRITDPMIAKGILGKEKQLGILGRKITRLCDPTCKNKKPNYMGGGQGPSTIDEFIATAKDPDVIQEYGEIDLTMHPGDANRELKIRQFRTRLDIPGDPKEMPMMMVYSGCEHFIRTIPSLCMDEERPEDLEDKQEDHIYDEACHICMARPVGSDLEELVVQIEKEKAKKKIDKLDSVSRTAAQEFFRKRRKLIGDEEKPDLMKDDPLLDPDVYGLPVDDEDDDPDLYGEFIW